MKTFKTYLEEAKIPDIKLGKYTFKYNKKDSNKERDWYEFGGVKGKYKDAFYITVSHDSKYAEFNWVISDGHGDGNELIDWIEDVQQKTKVCTDEMWGYGEVQEKYFDKLIIGPMEKAFEKHFKKMGYKTEISA